MAHADVLDSAHDISEGGIAVTLAECAFEKGIGFQANLPALDFPAESVLFGEDASRIIVSCDPQHLGRIKSIAGKHGLFADQVGQTVSGQCEIRLDGKVAISAKVSELRSAYEGVIERILKSDPELVEA